MQVCCFWFLDRKQGVAKKYLKDFPLKGFWEAIIIKPSTRRKSENINHRKIQEGLEEKARTMELAFHFGACLPEYVLTCKLISYFKCSFHNWILSFYHYVRNCIVSSCWAMIVSWKSLIFKITHSYLESCRQLIFPH